jgi:hypothetical protein
VPVELFTPSVSVPPGRVNQHELAVLGLLCCTQDFLGAIGILGANE